MCVVVQVMGTMTGSALLTLAPHGMRPAVESLDYAARPHVIDTKERERFMRWVVDYFREAAAEGTAVPLVVDPVGITADVDWDAVVRQAIPFPAVLPAMVGIPASWIKHLGDHSGYARERIVDFELLRSQARG